MSQIFDEDSDAGFVQLRKFIYKLISARVQFLTEINAPSGVL